MVKDVSFLPLVMQVHCFLRFHVQETEDRERTVVPNIERDCAVGLGLTCPPEMKVKL